MDNNILEIKNLKKIYHTKSDETVAIDNINLNIKEKEFVSIVGPSGSGKSTILSILANIIPKSEGTITYKDKKSFGYMLQSDALFPWLTIEENTLLGISIKRKPTKEDKQKANKLLDKYGLEKFKKSYPENLSGGMKQRVALIRTLMLDPDILLLDEPLSALDYQTRLALSNDLYKIIKEEGKTAIMVTHDIAEAISLSDRIILLSKRPSTIKKIYEIKLNKKGLPTDNRKDKEFINYYDQIWKDLDHHV